MDKYVWEIAFKRVTVDLKDGKPDGESSTDGRETATVLAGPEARQAIAKVEAALIDWDMKWSDENTGESGTVRTTAVIVDSVKCVETLTDWDEYKTGD